MRILFSEWTCKFFDNAAAAIEYIENGKTDIGKGQKITVRYDGNIFRHYESFAFFPAFLDGNYDPDNKKPDEAYSVRAAVCSGTTRDEVTDFNAQHDYKVPDGYYTKIKG